MFDKEIIDQVVNMGYGDILNFTNDYTAMSVTNVIPIMEVRKLVSELKKKLKHILMSMPIM